MWQIRMKFPMLLKRERRQTHCDLCCAISKSRGTASLGSSFPNKESRSLLVDLINVCPTKKFNILHGCDRWNTQKFRCVTQLQNMWHLFCTLLFLVRPNAVAWYRIASPPAMASNWSSVTFSVYSTPAICCINSCTPVRRVQIIKKLHRDFK